MKIYTKTGDKGETGLPDGLRVPKNDVRIHALGNIDELQALLGVIRALGCSKKSDQFLEKIQQDLFVMGAEIANVKKNSRFPFLASRNTKILEKIIDTMDKKLPELRNFILPGGSIIGSFLHYARTVCRRTERNVIALKKVPVNIIPYLNRLSDFLFILARFENFRKKKKETIWKFI